VYGTLDAALDAARLDEQAVHRDIRMESVRSGPARARRYVDAVIPVASTEVVGAVRFVVSELTTNVRSRSCVRCGRPRSRVGESNWSMP
jgi:hypothetical protein